MDRRGVSLTRLFDVKLNTILCRKVQKDRMSARLGWSHNCEEVAIGFLVLTCSLVLSLTVFHESLPGESTMSSNSSNSKNDLGNQEKITESNTNVLPNQFNNYACGITIRYPSDWSETEVSQTYRDNANSNELVYFSPNMKNNSLFSSDTNNDFTYVTISAQDLYGTNTLKGYTIRNLQAYENLPKFRLINSTTVYMGDYPANQIVFNSGSELKSRLSDLYQSLAVWTVQNNKAYEIRYDVSNPSVFDLYLPTVNKMIESVELSIPGEYFSDDYDIRC
jgi:hypothetical protein